MSSVEEEQDCDPFGGNREVVTDLLPEEPEFDGLLTEDDAADPSNNDGSTAGRETTNDGVAECTGGVPSCSVLVKQYSIRHNLTEEALSDLHLLRLQSCTDDVFTTICLFI